MEWHVATLDDVCLLITDGAHNSPKSVDAGFPMASVKDLTPHGINVSSCRLISEKDYHRLVHHKCHPQAEDIKRKAAGRCSQILKSLCGLTDHQLNPKVHGPCPDCGGTDRFRAFDDVNDSGGLLCNQCGKRSDVFASVQWLRNCTFSEALKLVADEIGQGRMLVTIPKTKHHEGKDVRFVPIGDILPWLEKAFDEAPEGSQRVITRFIETNVNLAKPFEKIIEAAGLTIWPKLIQNLRGSCETDWLDGGNPAHVVARWVGHSVKVQNDNYAQVDDHHFEQFNAQAKMNPVAIQVASETREIAKTGKPMKRTNPGKLNVLRGSADQCASLRSDQVPEAGVEPAHGITHTGF